jgi:hypothetical protein
MNAYGQAVYADTLNGPETTVQIKEKGVYYLRVTLDNAIVVKKVVVR